MRATRFLPMIAAMAMMAGLLVGCASGAMWTPSPYPVRSGTVYGAWPQGPEAPCGGVVSPQECQYRNDTGDWCGYAGSTASCGRPPYSGGTGSYRYPPTYTYTTYPSGEYYAPTPTYRRSSPCEGGITEGKILGAGGGAAVGNMAARRHKTGATIIGGIIGWLIGSAVEWGLNKCP